MCTYYLDDETIEKKSSIPKSGNVDTKSEVWSLFRKSRSSKSRLLISRVGPDDEACCALFILVVRVIYSTSQSVVISSDHELIAAQAFTTQAAIVRGRGLFIRMMHTHAKVRVHDQALERSRPCKRR
jgi:hypothetical protein